MKNARLFGPWRVSTVLSAYAFGALSPTLLVTVGDVHSIVFPVSRISHGYSKGNAVVIRTVGQIVNNISECIVPVTDIIRMQVIIDMVENG